ncbi:MAG TPA: hypothetical protein VJN95_11290 [Gemmatimonadales bacterium]|nr:hypothetical protein [Gemmatimonadales bacterium]
MTRRHWLALSIAGLALAASVTSLGNGFAYDDNLAILINPRVHTLHAPWQAFAESYWPKERGGGLYRPLTILLFGVQWAIGGGAPLLFHLVNVALYAALSVLVLTLASLILPEAAAWLVAALFAVHPVHVEAVGNVVGQAELTTALAVVAAVILYLRWRARAPSERFTGRQLGLLGALYLAGCFCKEHGVVLPALLLAAELTVVADPRPMRERLPTLRTSYLWFAALGLAFLALRTTVLGAFVGDQSALTFQQLDGRQRVLTMFGLVPEWLRLLYWPAHLKADYSPLETRVVTAVDAGAVAGALVLLAIIALGIALRQRRPVLSFGIGWALVALLPTSNLLLPTGILLAERTMMLPSVGALLVIGALIPVLVARLSPASTPRRSAVVVVSGLMALLIGVAAWRSALRQPVWANDDVLKQQMVLDAPRSYWAQWLYGDYLYNTDRLQEGERYMLRAVQIEPNNPYILMLLGQRYQDHGFCVPAAEFLARSVAITPERWRTRLRLIRCQLDLRRYDDARAQIRTGLEVGLSPSDFKAALVSVDSAARLAGQ